MLNSNTNSDHYDDKDFIVRVLTSALSALEMTIPQNVEVIVHDLHQPQSSVVAIINGHVSKRSTGSGLLTGPDRDVGFLSLNRQEKNHGRTEIIRDYHTVTSDGRKLSSASTIFFNQHGEPSVGFCVNTDLTPLDTLKKALSAMQPCDFDENAHKGHVANQMKTAVNRIIAECVSDGENIRGKRTREKIIVMVRAKGLFKQKGCVGYVAEILGVSRHTIYNDLKNKS